MAQILFNPDNVDMMQIAYKYHGNIAAIANHYKVSRDTVYEYFNRNHDGIEILKYIRKYNNEIHLDTAEYVLAYNMNNHKSNAALAQRAAEFVLDRKGHTRGYKQKPNEEEVNEQTGKQVKALLDQLSEMQNKQTELPPMDYNDLNSCDNNNNPAT